MALAAGCWGERSAAEREAAAPPSVARERPAQAWPASGRTHAVRAERDRCGEAIDRFFEVVTSDIQLRRGFSAGMIEEFQAAMLESCRETTWSAESLACYEEASSVSEAGGCFQAMTAEQREDFDRRFSEIRRRSQAAPPPSSAP